MGDDAFMTTQHPAITESATSWSEEDEKLALSEGWGMFDIGCGLLQLQRDDDVGVLESDFAAWELLRTPSPMHTRALSFLLDNSPGEWMRVTQGEAADHREMVVVSAGWPIACRESNSPAERAAAVAEAYEAIVTRLEKDADVFLRSAFEQFHPDDKIRMAWDLRDPEKPRHEGWPGVLRGPKWAASCHDPGTHDGKA